MAMLPTAGMPSNPVFKMLAGAAAGHHRNVNAHDLDFAGDPAAAAQMWLSRHPAARAKGNIPDFVIHDLSSAMQHAQHGAMAPAPQMPLAPPAPTPAPPVPIDVSNGFRAPSPVPIDVSNGFRAPGPGIGWFGPGGAGISYPEPGLPNPNLTNGVKQLGQQSLLARAAAGRY